MDLADAYRIFPPTSTQYTFFSATYGTFSRIDHILGHKASFSKHKKIEIISILSHCIKTRTQQQNNSRKYVETIGS
jgi:exonuclease III